MITKIAPEYESSKEVMDLWKGFRKEVIDCLRDVPTDELIKSPEGIWSLSEVAEHLYITQWNIARSVPTVMSGRGNSVFNGYTKEPDYRMIRLSLSKPSGVKNPDSVAPLNKYSFAELLPLLNKAESKLEDSTNKYSKADLMKYKMEHPYFGDLHLFDFLWVMSWHEHSHLYAIKKRTKELRG